MDVKRRLFIIILVFTGIALACAQVTPKPSPVPAGITQSPKKSSPTATIPVTTTVLPTNNPMGIPVEFHLGIEYAIPGVAKAYAPTGIIYAKPQPIFGMWGILEPQPGVFNWKPLDDLVIEYQTAGFNGIQLLITAESSWASIDFPAGLNPGNTFPKEEYLGDYAAFLSQFVERYDGDGMQDASGLLYGVHEYGIEREFTGYWPGSAADYVRLLRIAFPAIHSADPQARVLLVALLLGDVFDGNPTQSEIDMRLAKSQPFRKSYADIKTILSACDAYDIVDFHSLGNYTEIPPTAAWIRSQLTALNCPQKPLWIGDSFSMSPLVAFNGQPITPTTDTTRAQVIALLTSITDPKNTEYALNLTWLRAEMSRGLVKRVVVTAGAGIMGINLGNLEDWKTNISALDALAVPALGTSMFMGMMDTQLTTRTTADRLPNYSQAIKARPSFYALKLVAQKINNFISVEKLDLHADVWAYRFELPSGPVWVLWYDDGQLYLPGETIPATSVNIPFVGTEALITYTPTTEQETQPVTQTIPVTNNLITLTIDETPIFIQPGQ